MEGIEMERKIGEIFEIEGQWYQCIVGHHCSNCAFNRNNIPDGVCEETTGFCTPEYREDGKSVIFKKLEKVGEPFKRNGYTYQEYKAHTYPLLMSGGAKIPTDNGFAVIIKQKQEDMEEKKLNLKPFNLEQAKVGKPICTRDGRKARIICFDRVTNSTNEYTGPLIVLVTNLNGDEKPFCYTENGNLAGDEYDNHKWDLMMPSEKKSGWANIVKGSDGHPHMGRGIFQSKEAAEDAIKAFSSKLIDTIKIEWYE